jgi:hypothetical protein
MRTGLRSAGLWALGAVVWASAAAAQEPQCKRALEGVRDALQLHMRSIAELTPTCPGLEARLAKFLASWELVNQAKALQNRACPSRYSTELAKDDEAFRAGVKLYRHRIAECAKGDAKP